MSRFKKATRQQIKLRMAIDGPAGSGKSFSGILFALKLVADLEPGRRVAVIDTEAGSASKYQGEVVEGILFDFDVLELSNFAPTEYTSAIQEAGRLGYGALIIDSLSHAWAGDGGALDIKDRKGGNSFTAWKDVTPMHNRMIDSILRSPCHVIATMRTKTEYVLEEEINKAGKTIQVPRKIGMAPIQRAGAEYEFDIVGDIDWTHTLKISKSRCRSVADLSAVKPGPAFMDPIIAWLRTGTAAPVEPAIPPIGQLQVAVLSKLMTECGINEQAMRSGLQNKFRVSRLEDLNEAQGHDLQETLYRKKAQLAQQKAEQPDTTEQPKPEDAGENVSTNGQLPCIAAAESEA